MRPSHPYSYLPYVFFKDDLSTPYAPISILIVRYAFHLSLPAAFGYWSEEVTYPVLAPTLYNYNPIIMNMASRRDVSE